MDITYKVASTLAEITAAWNVVYRQYLRTELIDPNPFSIFTFPEYIGNKSVVILGRQDDVKPICSLSGVLDSEVGLPLDRHYKKELDELRKNGNKLIEIGLLADIRESNNMKSIVELMSAVARFGVFSNHFDVVIGVHPRRVEFFKRIFGCEIIGDLKRYDNLNVAPVVLLYATNKNLRTVSLKANEEILKNPLNLGFASRYNFDTSAFINSRIYRFVNNYWTKVEAA
ncbi:MAG: N-acyl amino acid synthase FeeM domain-containing protein [Bacteroidia bacterium]